MISTTYTHIRKSRDIPDKPPRPLPERKELPTLGTMARDAAALDLLQLSKGDAFEAKARAPRCAGRARGGRRGRHLR